MKLLILFAAGPALAIAVTPAAGGEPKTYSAEQGQPLEVEVSDGDTLDLGHGAVRVTVGGLVAPVLAPVGQPNEDGVVPGSVEEIQTRVDADGNHAPTPPFLGTPSPHEVAALAEVGVSAGAISMTPETMNVPPVPLGETDLGGESTTAAADDGPATLDAGAGEDTISGAGDTVEAGEPSSTLEAGVGNDVIISPPTPPVEPEPPPPAEETQSESTTSDTAPADTPVGGEGNDAVETSTEPREASDDEVTEALKQAAQEQDLGDDIVDLIHVQQVNTILKAKGLKPISADRRTEVQKATISPNL